MKKHHYKTTVNWTGNIGNGTENYRTYERSHDILVENKNVILGSSDSAFRGDNTKHNPEELLVASVSSCHMLWYLHFCSVAGITVTEYTDSAEGIMEETKNGSGRFSEITLHPKVLIKESEKVDLAKELHQKANEFCFIANSLNFKVKHLPEIIIAS